MKDKKHIIKLIDTEKVFNKTQHPFMIKTLQKVGIKVIYLNIKKPINYNPKANIILKGKN